MNWLRNFICFFLVTSFLHSETIYFDPQGDYATIDVEESEDLMNALLDDSLSDDERRLVAQKIASQPGSYIPVVLLKAGMCFLECHDFEKAALLCVAGIFRAEIDVRISEDITLGDVCSILTMNLAEFVDELLTKEDEQARWQEAFSRAVDNFVEWDKAMPRDYDDRWVRLHSLYVFGESTFTVLDEAQK